MNAVVGAAQIGEWYRRADKGEIFQVVGLDETARTIEIQNFDGDIDEIDSDTWASLPLAFSQPPEDWTGPVDDVEVDDLGYSETEMRAQDWKESLQPFRTTGKERWQDTTEGGDAEVEGVPAEELLLIVPTQRTS